MILVVEMHTHRRCLWGDREVGGGQEREDRRGRSGEGGQERDGEGNHHREELQSDSVMEANQECQKI